MLREFGELLRTFLTQQGVAPADRIFLDPPDPDFVRKVQGLAGRPALDVYLADLRENRKLRSNERLRTPSANGARVVETLSPSWVDAHYLMSAWDPSKNPNDPQKQLREHGVLAAASAALLEGDPFTPSEVYAADPTRLLQWPEEFRSSGLPYQVLPPEGFHRLSDFWTSMGQGIVWRPVVYLVASVPVVVPGSRDYPLVTTLGTTVGQTADAPAGRLVEGTEHPWFQIGGRVIRRVLGRAQDPNDATVFTDFVEEHPAVAARVLLTTRDDQALQSARTDSQGRFQFVFAPLPLPRAGPDAPQLYENRYRLRVRHNGLPDAPQDIVVPSPTGSYDLVFEVNLRGP